MSEQVAVDGCNAADRHSHMLQEALVNPETSIVIQTHHHWENKLRTCLWTEKRVSIL